MQKIRWFFLILAIVVALAVALQNNASTELQLFFFKRSLPLSVLLLSTTSVGFLMGALTTMLMLRRGKSAKAKGAKKAEPKPAPAEEMASETAESQAGG